VAVDTDTVRQMAKLARLEVGDEDVHALASEMGAILDFMGAIAQWEGETGPVGPSTARRPDVISDPRGAELIEVAADHEHGQVVVPPIKGAS